MKGTSRTSRMARQERVSRTHEGPHARKSVTHIVTILCVQGAPRGSLSLPRDARFSLLTRPYVPILLTFILVSLNFAEYYSENA